MIPLMNTSRMRTLVLVLAVALLAMLAVACNDWDGLDRSGWGAEYSPPTQPAPTPQATPPNVQPGDEYGWRVIWGDTLQSE